MNTSEAIKAVESTVPITSATVSVKRSHDYNNFEVRLTTEDAHLPIGAIDELRKTAARLVDKAVEQYKVAKANCDLIQSDAWTVDNIKREAEKAEKIPEDGRSPRQKAYLKWVSDRNWKARNRYDYEDEWDEPEAESEPEPEDSDEDVVF